MLCVVRVLCVCCACVVRVLFGCLVVWLFVWLVGVVLFRWWVCFGSGNVVWSNGDGDETKHIHK